MHQRLGEHGYKKSLPQKHSYLLEEDKGQGDDIQEPKEELESSRRNTVSTKSFDRGR